MAKHIIKFGVFAVLFAAFVPNLEAFVGLVGAACDSTLILFFPPIIELVTFWENDAYMGPCRWKVYKNLLVIIIWLITLVSGTQTSVVKIIALYSWRKEVRKRQWLSIILTLIREKIVVNLDRSILHLDLYVCKVRYYVYFFRAKTHSKVFWW